jgi:protein-S-isoprenylcysteine O-methyltransferase Ste14
VRGEVGARSSVDSSGKVRNPVFTAMALTGAGLAFIVPNWIELGGVAVLVVALQLQVRVVEEPYLLATHGEQYRRYAATTGRFLPGLGHFAVPRS